MIILPNIQHNNKQREGSTKGYLRSTNREKCIFDKIYTDEYSLSINIFTVFSESQNIKDNNLNNFNINSEEISNIDDDFYNFNKYINSMHEVEKNILSFSNYKNDNLDDHERLALTLQWSIGAEKRRCSLI